MFEFDPKELDLNTIPGMSMNPCPVFDDEDYFDLFFDEQKEACKFVLGITGNPDPDLLKVEQSFFQRTVEVYENIIKQLPASTAGVDISGVDAMTEEGLRAWKRQLKIEGKNHGLVVTSEYRPGAKTHASGRPSNHSKSIGNEQGMALDFGGSKTRMAAFFDYIRATYAPENIRELIYSPKGRVYRGSYSSWVENATTRADHYDHVHVALWGTIKRKTK